MINIEKYDNLKSSGIFYGGHSGSKKGVIIDNERWFLKYPKSTRSMDDVNISYTTTPLSEYLGSQIYELIGLDVHKTRLGIFDNKIVVACKDFLKETEVIFDYNSIKNEYDSFVEKGLESLSKSNNSYDLDEVIFVMKHNSYFKSISSLVTRFWDMFIVDAFISNNDRNESNWGLIYDKALNKYRVCPVFDNGASFYNKNDDEKILTILNDNTRFVQVAYHSSISAFKIDEKKVNPLKYIESMNNKECNAALLRLFPKINLNAIKNVFEEIPEEYNGHLLFTKIQKEFYLKVLEYRYNAILKPIYEKLKEE